MREFTNEDIKNVSLEILDRVHTFCIKNNLKYSLSFGTLLGAIRHNGFIPWDDDIDIMMPRKDYNFLLEHFGDETYAVMSCWNNSKYILPYAKVYRKNTLLISGMNKANLCNIGFNIDVFPFDIIEDRQSFNIKRRKELRLLKKYRLSLIDFKFGKNVFVKIFKFIISIPFAKKANKYSRKIDAVFMGGAEDGYYLHNEIYQRKDCFYKKELFDKFEMHKFENREYLVISSYDYFLKEFYGDYMKLPPIEERVTHHTFKAYFK